MAEIIWYSGKDNYRKHTFSIATEINKDSVHFYNTELLDVEIPENRNINDIFFDSLSERQTKTVEVLYSGGLDSECVLISCLKNSIPVRAMTMKLMIHGYPINTHDIYYSEKFCRANKVEQVFLELDVLDFFESGKYADYLIPYLITSPHSGTHFWLLEQCSGFPVMGGDYSWPNKTKLSPHRHLHNQFDRFLQDRGIHGIGSMISHSLESNLAFIKAHVNLMSTNLYFSDFRRIPKMKQKLFENLGFENIELRMRNHGWEMVPPGVFKRMPYHDDLISKVGITFSSITWNKKIAAAINSEPGTSDSYV